VENAFNAYSFIILTKIAVNVSGASPILAKRALMPVIVQNAQLVT
jgi:hypothetical protein